MPCPTRNCTHAVRFGLYPKTAIAGVSALLFVLSVSPGALGEDPTGTAQSPVEQSDSRVALLAVIEALKRTQHVASGRGAASVVIYDDGRKEERSMDFMFKGTSSRCDTYEASKGDRGEFAVTWAANPENAVVRGKRSASIQNRPPPQFHRVQGYDFHPAVFQGIFQRPLHRHLEVLLTLPGKTSVILDGNGILHAQYDDYDPKTEASSHLSIAIDTNDGYRLLSYQDRTKNLNGPGSSTTIRWKVTWRKYGTEWYPEKALFEEEHLTVLRKGRSIPARQETYRAEIQVQDFQPNAEVEDAAFTLKGLNLPVGTSITDEITGITYHHGGPVLRERDLEKALEQSGRFAPILSQPATARAQMVRRTAHAGEGGPAESKGRPYGMLAAVVTVLGVVMVLCALGVAIWRRRRRSTQHAQPRL